MKLLEELTPEHVSQARQLRVEWREQSLSTAPIDRSFVEESVAAVYRMLGKTPPNIVWCESPFQLIIVPMMLQEMKKDSNRGSLRQRFASLLSRDTPAERWKKMEDALWRVVSAHAPQALPSIGADEDAWLSTTLDFRLKSLTASLFSRLGGQIDGLSLSQLREELRSPPDDGLSLQIVATLFRRNLAPSRLEERLRGRSTIWWGTWERRWLAFYHFFRQYIVSDIYNKEADDELTVWTNLAQSAVGYQFFEGVCFVCLQPDAIHIDDGGALHNETGSALEFSDGYTIHSWQGITVDSYVIEQPELITVRDIETEPNINVRRVKILRYGEARYLKDTHAELVHEDECGALFVKDASDDEPLAMVRVINSTAEPDGSFKEYYIRVPPDITTARAAVAWTFGMTAEEYTPALQT